VRVQTHRRSIVFVFAQTPRRGAPKLAPTTKESCMKNLNLAALAAVAAIVCLPLLVSAANAAPPNAVYWVDSSGNVWRNASGECWRSGQWTPALATAPCDPVLQAPAVIAAAPAPKAAEPTAMPAPVAKVAPVAMVPMRQKVSFSGDALFAFDKSELRPESRVLLDDLSQKLVGTTSDVLTVTGHTDRIGPPAYNQKLSERRANAVKDYLVGKNIPTGSIEAKGMGESQPITVDCKGNKATSALITCLQPDRRVDVEMTGTQPGAALQ
jgi:OOP family OmpA-OmpF porin